MADITRSGNNILVTSTDSDNFELTLSDYVDGRYTACIKVRTGDYQFNVGAACDENNDTWTDGENVFPFAFGTGLGKINCKADGVGRTFSIGVR
jgi:hypothetical protein